MISKLTWDGTFHGKFEDKAYAIEQFNEHNEAVKSRLPQERLVVHEVREGWKPLADMLGVQVPDGVPEAERQGVVPRDGGPAGAGLLAGTRARQREKSTVVVVRRSYQRKCDLQEVSVDRERRWRALGQQGARCGSRGCRGRARRPWRAPSRPG